MATTRGAAGESASFAKSFSAVTSDLTATRSELGSAATTMRNAPRAPSTSTNFAASAAQTFKTCRRDDEHARRAAGDERGHDGERLRRLAEAGLVREHAAAAVAELLQHPADAVKLVAGQCACKGVRHDRVVAFGPRTSAGVVSGGPFDGPGVKIACRKSGSGRV